MAKVIADTLKACKLDVLSQMPMGLAGVPEENSISKLGKLFTDSSRTSAIHSVSEATFKSCENCTEGVVCQWGMVMHSVQGRKS